MNSIMISKRHLAMILSFGMIISLWSSVILSKLLKKNVNTIAIEVISSVISSMFYIYAIVGIITYKKENNKEAREEECTQDKLKKLEKYSLYVDVIGTSICCIMQLITTLDTIYPTFCKENKALSITHRAVDIMGVVLGCIAMSMLLATLYKSTKQSINIEDEEKLAVQESKKTQKRKRILMTSIMLLGLSINLIGKSILSFIPRANLQLSHGENFNLGLFIRLVGITVFTVAFFCEIVKKPLSHTQGASTIANQTPKELHNTI